MNDFVFRDYQERAAGCVFEEWKEKTSTLLVLPTGTGKTCVFAEIIRRMQPLRAMVLAHREELIYQARDKIESIAGLSCEVEMAAEVAATSLFHRTPVVIATVQTLNSGNGKKRMERFNPMDFGLVIVDEGHHITAPSYVAILDHFKQNPALKILAVTATPDRADEEALGQIIETVAFDYEIIDAVQDGWLVPIEQQMVKIDGLDFSGIRTTAGDLNGADLAAVMEAEKTMHGLCGATVQIIGDKRTMLFTVTVRQAEMACDILNRHRQDMAGWICGKTPKDERRKILDKFRSGKTQVLCNVGVLTEGVDIPATEVIIMGRPTKSRSLYAQMAGRATRPLPGIVDGPETPELRREAIAISPKASCLIVDFVGNSGRHKLITTADILGGKVSDEAAARVLERAKQEGKAFRMTDELADEQAKIHAEIEARKREEAARKARLVAKVQYSARTIDPFNAFELSPVRERGWDSGKTLTEKQRAILIKQGVSPDGMQYGAAKQVLDETFRRWNNGLCSLKQAALLKKHGVETHDLKREDASALITRLAENGWRGFE